MPFTKDFNNMSGSEIRCRWCNPLKRLFYCVRIGVIRKWNEALRVNGRRTCTQLEEMAEREQENERKRKTNKGDRGICRSHSLIHKSGRCQVRNPVSRPHQSQATHNPTDRHSWLYCRIPSRGIFGNPHSISRFFCRLWAQCIKSTCVKSCVISAFGAD